MSIILLTKHVETTLQGQQESNDRPLLRRVPRPDGATGALVTACVRANDEWDDDNVDNGTVSDTCFAAAAAAE